MKLLNYTLAGVLGAFVASLLMPRWLDSRPEPVAAGRVDEPRPMIVRTEVTTGPELDRLSRENAGLSAQLAEVRARLTERDAAIARANEQLNELRRPLSADILSSTLRAELKSGEVVVTGGYALPDGRRLYAFSKPEIHQVDGSEVVTISGRFLSLTEDAGKAVGLDSIATNAANTLQHGEVWVAEEQEAVLAQLAGVPGMDVLVYPSITVKPGGSGLIEIGDVQLKVTPTLADGDGTQLKLDVRLEQPLPAPAAGPPSR